MLQSFRDNIKGTVAIILVGLICIPFALFGIDSLFNSNPNRSVVASVNGEDITQFDLERALQMQRRQLMSQFGDSLPAEFLSDERLREPVLQSLIQKESLMQSAKKSDMAVADAVVDKIIVETGDFQVDGKFDVNMYQQLLRQAGFTNQTYKDLLREEIILNQFALGVGQSNFALPTEVDQLATLGLQERSFQYLTVGAVRFMDSVEATEEAINDYYQSNIAQFMTPESVVIEAIELDAVALAQDLTVTDEDIEEQYEFEKDSFESSIERHAAHILIDDSADTYDSQLAEIQQRLADGEEFAVLAKEFSVDDGSKNNGGDVGVSSGEVFVPEFEEALAGLEIGEISQPVKTQFGVHIIKLLDKQSSEMPSLDEMRLTIVEQIKNNRSEQLFIEKLEEFKDYTYNVSDLAPAAEQLGLELWTSESFSRDSASGIARLPGVTAAAFSDDLIDSGRTSDVLEVDPTTAVVIRVVEHQPESAKPLDEVRDAVVASVKNQLAFTEARKEAEALLARLKSGEALSTLADELSLELKTVDDAKRQQPGVNAKLVGFAFSLPEPAGQPESGLLELNSRELSLVSLESVVNGDAAAVSPAERAAVANQVTQLLGNADLLGIRAQIVDSAEVENL